MRASIIIPSYNACERLYYNLLSLNTQSCNRELFEVIVVDDGSKDNTKNLLANFNANFKLRSILLRENKGRANARNCAINEAKGDILIFHDSDMIAEKDYVIKYIEAHKENGTVVSGMNWRKIYTYYYKDFTGPSKENLRKQLEKMESKKRYVHLEPIVDELDIVNGKCFEYAFLQSNYKNAENAILQSYGNDLEGYSFPWILFITNNCSAFRKDIIDAGAFDSTFLTWGCEDLDLGYRLYKNNCRFIKANDINSLHQEHPVYLHKNIMENIYLFTSKYNSIDILLLYYGKFANINRQQADIILQELEELKKDDKYAWFIELYRKLLIYLRDTNCKTSKEKNINEMKEIRQSVISEIEDIQAVLYNLEIEKKLLATALSFKVLIKRALGPNYKIIKI